MALYSNPEEINELMDAARANTVFYVLETDLWDQGKEIAERLIECNFEAQTSIQEIHEVNLAEIDGVWVCAPPKTFELWNNGSYEWAEIQKIVVRCLPDEELYKGVDLRLKRRTYDPRWEDRIRAFLSGADTHNQGALIRQPQFDDLALRYRSQAEIKIANALRRAGVLFMPLPVAVIGNQRLEPDFLICHVGQWGVLEVDGAPYHTSAAKDHERDKRFNELGVKYIRHYDATRCHENADAVVKEFLTWLNRMYNLP